MIFLPFVTFLCYRPVVTNTEIREATKTTDLEDPDSKQCEHVLLLVAASIVVSLSDIKILC
jgi:hypothetical protein